ncbi:MAG: FprA family A-type flavoprotein [Anaerolineaceae bacterium]|jgi:flavorubredoxin|nr:MAG: FprA family A-type flavoprotein [Anaerolineaceae bacterium]
MKPIALSDGIFWIGVNDTTTKLFEGLWSIEKEGISYNSYLIKDEKSALIDLSKSDTGDLLIENIKACIDPQQLTYLVVNHMEPDHSGAIRKLLKIAPHITILGNEKTREMLASFFGITEHIQTVTDGESIALGKHSLRFLSTPMVHWPETIMTYEETSGILFSCDGFGGYGKLENGIFDDQQSDLDFYEKESLRYFSNIVCAFSKPVLKAAEKIAALKVNMVAPSHGLVWRSKPARILDLYIQWSGYAGGNYPKKVCLLHASMYGNTARIVPVIEKSIQDAGYEFESMDVTQTHISSVLPALWKSAGVVICAPTYEGALFPTMEFVLEMADKKRMTNKKAIYIGSYGWGGGAMRFINKQCEILKWELLGNVEFKGQALDKDLQQIQSLTAELATSLS